MILSYHPYPDCCTLCSENFRGTFQMGDLRRAGNGDMQFRAGSQAISPTTGQSMSGTNFHWCVH